MYLKAAFLVKLLSTLVTGKRYSLRINLSMCSKIPLELESSSTNCTGNGLTGMMPTKMFVKGLLRTELSAAYFTRKRCQCSVKEKVLLCT